MLDYIDSTNTKVAYDELGTLWYNFEECLVPETAIIFNNSYNLITMALRESTLPLDLTTLLVDESQDITSLVNNVRETFLVFICDILNSMGVIVDKDQVDLDSLVSLNNLLNFFYVTDGCDDVLGLIYVLENETFTNKERLVECVKKVYDLDGDEDYNNLITDVSSDVVKGLLISLGVDTDSTDDREYVNDEVVKRTRNNKEFIKDTLAESHIKDGGTIGLSYQVLSDLFINDIAKLIVDNKKQYYKEILALLIISSMTNVEIESGYEGMVKDFSSDLDELYLASTLLEGVNLE